MSKTLVTSWIAALLLGLVLVPTAWALVYVYALPNPRELTPEQRFAEWCSIVRFVVGAFVN